jgi:hypothetical protein
VKWLLDAMLAPDAADQLGDFGHDAVSVLRIGMVNLADFAEILADRQNSGAPSAPIVFIRRDALPRRGALASHLARRLDQWAAANAEPFVGLYWA